MAMMAMTTRPDLTSVFTVSPFVFTCMTFSCGMLRDFAPRGRAGVSAQRPADLGKDDHDQANQRVDREAGLEVGLDRQAARVASGARFAVRAHLHDCSPKGCCVLHSESESGKRNRTWARHEMRGAMKLPGEKSISRPNHDLPFLRPPPNSTPDESPKDGF